MMEQPYTVAMVPVHLMGARAIAEKFRVHENTVKLWKKEGAPIAFVGRMYQAEYSALQAWLISWSGEN